MIGSTYRFTVGDFVCVSFCDADQIRDGVTLFPSVDGAALEKGFSEGGYQTNALQFSMNVLYIRTPEHSILVDTGLGGSIGKLPESLMMAGIELNKIDTVIITHGHGDHIGGIIGKDGTPTFPKARYAIWKDEWAYWLDIAQKSDDPNNAARRNLIPIQDKVLLLEKEWEFLPGIHAIHAPGHTMGHMALLIASRGEQLLHIVDTAHHPVQLGHPNWSPHFDVKPDLSATTRMHLLGQAASKQIPIMAYHFAFPGIGRVERAGDAFAWKPVSA